MEELKKYLPIYLRICRSLALYFSYLAIAGIAGLCAGKLPAAVAILCVLTFHSTVRVFGETDRHIANLATAYRETADGLERSTRKMLRLILTSKQLLIELAVLLLVPVLLPVEAGYTAFATLLFGNPAAVPRALLKVATLGVVFPLFFGFWLLARYYSFLWWSDQKRCRDHPHPWLTLILKLLFIAAIYAVGGFLLVYILAILASVFNILRAIASHRPWLPLTLIGGLVLLVFLIRFWRAVRIRRKFLKRLKRLCRELHVTLSPIKRPYRSLFRLTGQINFSIKHGEKIYSCMLFGALNRRNPLYFSEKGIVQCLHSFRFRRVEYFRYTTQFDFSFEAQGTKVLIVIPVSKEIFAGHTEYFRLIDTGETVGEYKIFTATGFLGALSRDVVDR